MLDAYSQELRISHHTTALATTLLGINSEHSPQPHPLSKTLNTLRINEETNPKNFLDLLDHAANWSAAFKMKEINNSNNQYQNLDKVDVAKARLKQVTLRSLLIPLQMLKVLGLIATQLILTPIALLAVGIGAAVEGVRALIEKRSFAKRRLRQWLFPWMRFVIACTHGKWPTGHTDEHNDNKWFFLYACLPVTLRVKSAMLATQNAYKTEKKPKTNIAGYPLAGTLCKNILGFIGLPLLWLLQLLQIPFRLLSWTLQFYIKKPDQLAIPLSSILFVFVFIQCLTPLPILPHSVYKVLHPLNLLGKLTHFLHLSHAASIGLSAMLLGFAIFSTVFLAKYNIHQRANPDFTLPLFKTQGAHKIIQMNNNEILQAEIDGSFKQALKRAGGIYYKPLLIAFALTAIGSVAEYLIATKVHHFNVSLTLSFLIPICTLIALGLLFRLFTLPGVTQRSGQALPKICGKDILTPIFTKCKLFCPQHQTTKVLESAKKEKQPEHTPPPNATC